MIEEYLKLGSLNRLKISKKTPQGLYLEALDGDMVLLPNRYVEDNMKIGDEIEVFIVNDSEDRYVATTKKPKYEYGEFGIFEVIGKTDFGYFVDFGMEKDLFLPFGNTNKNLKIGDKVIGKSFMMKKVIGFFWMQNYCVILKKLETMKETMK
ncbi:MAG: S1-like domain-containing RNA-binding protein [Nautiliaceae bacterium]